MLGRENREINKAFEIRSTDKDIMAEAFYDLLLASEVESVLDERDKLVNHEMVARLKLNRLELAPLPLTPANRDAIFEKFLEPAKMKPLVRRLVNAFEKADDKVLFMSFVEEFQSEKQSCL